MSDHLKSYVLELTSAVTADTVLLNAINALKGIEPTASFTPLPPQPSPQPEPPKTKVRRMPPRTSKNYLPVVPWAKKFGLEPFSTETCMQDMRNKGIRLSKDDEVALKAVAYALSKSAASILNLGDGMWRYKLAAVQRQDF